MATDYVSIDSEHHNDKLIEFEPRLYIDRNVGSDIREISNLRLKRHVFIANIWSATVHVNYDDRSTFTVATEKSLRYELCVYELDKGSNDEKFLASLKVKRGYLGWSGFARTADRRQIGKINESRILRYGNYYSECNINTLNIRFIDGKNRLKICTGGCVYYTYDIGRFVSVDDLRFKFVVKYNRYPLQISL